MKQFTKEDTIKILAEISNSILIHILDTQGKYEVQDMEEVEETASLDIEPLSRLVKYAQNTDKKVILNVWENYMFFAKETETLATGDNVADFLSVNEWTKIFNSLNDKVLIEILRSYLK